MPIVHPSILAVGDHFADPMLRVTEVHGPLHVTVHNAETDKRRDVWFNNADRVHRA